MLWYRCNVKQLIYKICKAYSPHYYIIQLVCQVYWQACDSTVSQYVHKPWSYWLEAEQLLPSAIRPRCVCVCVVRLVWVVADVQWHTHGTLTLTPGFLRPFPCDPVFISIITHTSQFVRDENGANGNKNSQKGRSSSDTILQRHREKSTVFQFQWQPPAPGIPHPRPSPPLPAL